MALAAWPPILSRPPWWGGYRNLIFPIGFYPNGIGEPGMSEAHDEKQRAIREAAYFLWENEGCPEGRELDHWLRAGGAKPGEEEKVLAGRADANIPALLTKDVPGG